MKIGPGVREIQVAENPPLKKYGDTIFPPSTKVGAWPVFKKNEQSCKAVKSLFLVQESLERYTLTFPCTSSHSHPSHTCDLCENLRICAPKHIQIFSAQKSVSTGSLFAQTKNTLKASLSVSHNCNLTTVSVVNFEEAPLPCPSSPSPP